MEYSLELYEFYLRLEQVFKTVREDFFHYILYIFSFTNFSLMNNDQILEKTPEKLSADISTLIRNRSFFTDVEAVNTLLGPVKSVVKSLKFKTTTLADCFIELIKLSLRINSLPPVSNYDFKHQCVELFNSVGRNLTSNFIF